MERGREEGESERTPLSPSPVNPVVLPRQLIGQRSSNCRTFRPSSSRKHIEDDSKRISQGVLLSVCPSVCPSICLSVHLAVCPSVCLSIWLCLCLSVSFQSVFIAVFLFVYPSISSYRCVSVQSVCLACSHSVNYVVYY